MARQILITAGQPLGGIGAGRISTAPPAIIPIPNPAAAGGFKRSVTEPVAIFDAENEDRLFLTQVLEDPARNRLLLLAYTRELAQVSVSLGRDLYLFEALDPFGPWTRLTPFGSPLLGRGNTGDWDEANVFGATACIVNNTMYLAYSGQAADYQSAGPRGRIGLATADLTQAIPQAEKVGSTFMQLGNLPYKALGVGLWQEGGAWVLHAFAERGTGDTYTIPRRYTNPDFSLTGWTLDPRLNAEGDHDVYDSSIMGSVARTDHGYLGFLYGSSGPADNIYNLFHVTYNGDVAITANWTAQGIRATMTEGDWDEAVMAGPTPLYYDGQWYVFYAGNDYSGHDDHGGLWAWGNRIGCAAWDPEETIPHGTNTVIRQDIYTTTSKG